MTGAASWRMKRWEGMFTETCSGNETNCFCLFTFLILNISNPIPYIHHSFVLQLQEENIGYRNHQEREKDLIWVLRKVCELFGSIECLVFWDNNPLSVICHCLFYLSLPAYCDRFIYLFYFLVVVSIFLSEPVCLFQLWLQRCKCRDRWSCVASATEANKLWQEHVGLWPVYEGNPKVGSQIYSPITSTLTPKSTAV